MFTSRRRQIIGLIVFAIILIIVAAYLSTEIRVFILPIAKFILGYIAGFISFFLVLGTVIVDWAAKSNLGVQAVQFEILKSMGGTFLAPLLPQTVHELNVYMVWAVAITIAGIATRIGSSFWFINNNIHGR